MLAHILNALWPSRCLSCNSSISRPGLCPPCEGTLVPSADVSCSHCGNVFLDLPGPSQAYVCGPCLLSPPVYHQCRSAFAYGGALRDAIVRWKNEPRPDIGPILARLMLSQIDVSHWSGQNDAPIVVPVPTSFQRAMKRGFNPAGQLAQSIARASNLECRPNGLTLRMHFQSTQGLTRDQRRKRATHRFVAPSDVAGKNVLLVDDVRTTGRTISEASLALAKAHAKKVDIVVLAAVPDRS